MSDPAHSRRYERALSPLDRLFLMGDRLYPPFVIQCVLEGEGKFDLPRWQEAAKRASAATPGSGLVLRGHLGWSRWVDSAEPLQVHLVDGGNWDGRSPENAPFLERPLPARTGPTCEVLLLSGKPSRVIFRAHHGVTDAGGGLLLMKNLFRQLRGEPALGATGTENNLQAARRLGAGRLKIPKINCRSPLQFDPNQVFNRRSTWRRMTIPGKHSKPLAKIANLIAKQAHKSTQRLLAMTENGKTDTTGKTVVRLDILTDLRRHSLSQTPSTANQIGMITIDISAKDTVHDIVNTINAHRGGDSEGKLAVTLAPIRWVPIRLLVQFWHLRVRLAYKKSNFATSASITNVGLLPTQDFHGGGFKANTVFALPPGTSGIPLLITLVGTPQQIEVVAMAPDIPSMSDQLEKLLADIRKTLEKPPGSVPPAEG